MKLRRTQKLNLKRLLTTSSTSGVATTGYFSELGDKRTVLTVLQCKSENEVRDSQYFSVSQADSDINSLESLKVPVSSCD